LPELILLRFKSCGMLFLDTPATDTKREHEAYWKMLVNNTGGEGAQENSMQTEALFEELGARRNTGNLIEIGSGDGSLLHKAQEKGWHATGIELSGKAASLARDKYGVDIFTGTLESAYPKLQPASFDAAIMWGVIEHLKQPKETLATLRALLRKGGVLVIYTPNADSIFHKAARAIYVSTFGRIRFFMERVIIAMHFMYFTPDTLQKILHGCGFRVVKTEMADIDIDFIFRAHSNFWWSNKAFLGFAKMIQKIGHINSMHSHMIVFAESV
jgi:2-polyprenyl-3-methyl-5-hydroxy-6-metoxy-1,4-benzoquinol methylase